MGNWMLYGATGYTGVLLAEEAVKRGHRPVLAGRSEEKLKPLAQRLGLEYSAFNLTDSYTAIGATKGFDLVLHAAGPFTYTAAPMIKACLTNKAHYLDITGEISVYQHTFSQDEVAKQAGVALISGVGFDIIPSDCLNLYVAQKFEHQYGKRANDLIVALDALSGDTGELGASAGTTKSGLEILAHTGSVVRRDGKLVRVKLGEDARWFTFPHGMRYAMAFPWGDVETAYHTTGIPNTTVYLAQSPGNVRLLRSTRLITQTLLRSKRVRDVLGKIIDRRIAGPSEKRRAEGRSFIYARASDDDHAVEAWLETAEGYHFTALAGIRAVERTLELKPSGAITPACAFGADFVLEIEGSQRRDSLVTV